MDQESITGQDFDLNRRGYDPDEVDAHLRKVAAEVAAKQGEIDQLRRAMAELQAKVRDADESEEALRLTLKAAAHAKEELLSSARDNAATIEREATEKAQQLVGEAEANAAAITQEAEARAAAMTEGASARARDVARAALSESELVVVRIEQLRTQVQNAEDALHALRGEATPRLEETRQVLDAALDAARSSAENPELLAAAAVPPPQQRVPSPPAAPQTSAMPAESAENTPGEAPQPIQAIQSDIQPIPTGIEEPDAPVEKSEPAVTEPQGEEQSDSVAESSADISDKVDRLLEELREVT